MFATRGLVFLRQVWEEFGKITWPSRAETIRLTILVIIVSGAVAAFIGGLDFVFSRVLNAILLRQ
jgi:preprotein translocase subunit SecE